MATTSIGKPRFHSLPSLSPRRVAPKKKFALFHRKGKEEKKTEKKVEKKDNTKEIVAEEKVEAAQAKIRRKNPMWKVKKTLLKK